MIEFCTNCREEHETGDLKPIEGVPVKTCPAITGYGSGMLLHPRTLRNLYDLKLIDAIHYPADRDKLFKYGDI